MTDTKANITSKSQELSWLERHGATCFWLAMALCIPPKDLSTVVQAFERHKTDVREGVSATEAVTGLRKVKWGTDLYVYFHNSETGVVDTLKRGNAASGVGLLFVECGMDGTGQAHWLPVERVKKGQKFVLRQAEADEKPQSISDCIARSSPAVDQYALALTEVKCSPYMKNKAARLPETLEPYDDPLPFRNDPLGFIGGKSKRFLEREKAAALDKPADTFEDWERIELSDGVLDKVKYIAGATPPPATDKVVIFENGGTDGLTANVVCAPWRKAGVLRKVADSIATRRVVAGGFRSIEMHELNEEVVGTELREGTLLYSRVEAEHPLDDRKYITGAYKHDCVSSIACTRYGLPATYVLKRLGNTSDGYEISQLRFANQFNDLNTLAYIKMKVDEVMGNRKYCTVKKIMLKERRAGISADLVSALPNTTAKIRALGAVMVPLLDESVVGPFRDTVLEMIGEKEGAKKDVVAAASQLQRLAEASLESRQGRKAFACP